MSAEERKKVLQMVQDGKISAEQAASLMRAIDQDSAGADVEVIETGTGAGSEKSSDAPEFDQVKARARRFAMIPLWIGVFITVFSAWGMYSIQENAGANFWFFFLMLPFLLGVLLIALGAGSRSSRWIYIDVDRRNASAGDGPRHVTLALPLPLGLVSWFFRTFGYGFKGMSKGKVDGIVQMLEVTQSSGEPLIINVDESSSGERVQLYIG
jgi:hypothetical protein